MNKFNAVTGLMATAALAGGAHQAQAYEGVSRTQEQQAQNYQEQLESYNKDFAAYCIETAAGVSSGGLNDIDPAGQLGSRYPSKNMRKFSMTVIANQVPEDCREIVTGRTIKAEQIYRGKVNTKRPEVWTGLDVINDTRHTVLKAVYKCMKGKKSRAYKEKASISITTNGYGTYNATSYDTVRPKHDGC